MYGKLIDGQIIPAPNPIPDLGGYLPIVYTLMPMELPDDGNHYTATWEERDGKIVRVWTQASQQWAYYAAEGRTDKTDTLTALIASAKAEIRTQYPD